ncbi:hypothetical protein OBBRIDRAFT_793394 [Obba rivulosa]|uniref:F-box domain-containing protein n=1 Tax=Obba rivulosa TaxID=1052685 RepID=A0A8E2AY95_9APHY|nr:hypothetical protein OBBRIDRAFT_793394 [Obba rivulosa]
MPDKSWLAMTHVCRFWRDAALGSPLLWRYIRILGVFASDIPFLQTSLERSQDVLVHIAVDAQFIPRTVVQDLMDVIEAHAAHIAVLDLWPDGANLHFRLNFPMPELESLVLCGGDEEDTWSQLVDDQLPRLRKLTLDRALAPWKWPPSRFTHLVALNILGLQSNRWPSMDDFLHMLEACQSLESLTIHDVAPKLKWWRIGDKPLQTVMLPSLHSLEIQGNVVDITTLLTHLTPCSIHFISLRYRHGKLGQQDAHHAQAAIAQALRLLSRDSPPLEIQRLVLQLERQDKGPAAWITCWGPDQDSPYLAIRYDADAVWPVRGTVQLNGKDFEALFLHSLKGVSFTGPRELDIQYLVPPQRMGIFSARQWSEIFRYFPALTRLSIAGQCAFILFDELSISSSSASFAICPLLIHLTYSTPSYDTTAATALHWCVASRATHGRPLQSLHLRLLPSSSHSDAGSVERDARQALSHLVDDFQCLYEGSLHNA